MKNKVRKCSECGKKIGRIIYGNLKMPTFAWCSEKCRDLTQKRQSK